VLFSSITPEAATARAEAFRLALSDRRFRWEGKELNISVSLGIAMIDGSMDGNGVKALADLALAAAKEAGRNQVVLFQSERDRATSLAEANRLAAMIKEALGEKRFRLYFQPVVHLTGGAVDHYEALIRLVQPDGTVLLPGAFLGAAERFRLMPAIDRWVLEETVRVLEARPDLRICMNLSGQSLSDASLLAHTEGRLRQATGVAERLSFEITETVAVTDIDRLALWMEQLQQLGCIFALDDFGIGFCSFAYLRNLPADYIKIDGSFIKNLDADPTNRSLVEAMCGAAHTLGKRVVAECVENETIARILHDIGIEYGQGYKWGKPSPEIP
jgi:EAL domain-containing protein (putative c-di-GMP-specific phosphodiesterase class I)